MGCPPLAEATRTENFFMIFLNNLGLMSTRELVAMVGSYQLQPPVKKPQDLGQVLFFFWTKNPEGFRDTPPRGVQQVWPPLLRRPKSKRKIKSR